MASTLNLLSSAGVVSANCHSPRFGGSADYAGRGRLLKRSGASVLILTETTAAMRDGIRAVLGKTWKVYVERTGNSVCIMWNSDVWNYRARRQLSFGDRYHGAICVPLIHRTTRVGIDFIATHTRPTSVASPAQKRADVYKAANLAGSWPAILAGDFNLDADTILTSWKRLTADVDTVDVKGAQHYDAIYSKPARWTVSGRGILDPGNLSDHRWPWAELLLAGPR